MIIRMAKVELIGPKPLLFPVLGHLREAGVVQLEAGTGTVGSSALKGLPQVRQPAEAELSRRLILAELRRQLQALCACLPAVTVRPGYLDPAAMLEAVAALAPRHLEQCRQLEEREEAQRRQTKELARKAQLLETLGGLLQGMEAPPELMAVLGVTLREPALADELRREAGRLSGGRFELHTAAAADGSIVGIIATEPGLAEQIRLALQEDGIAELQFPPELAALPMAQRILALRRQVAAAAAAAGRLRQERERFARHWLPFYGRVADWLDEQLDLFDATTAATETDLCFLLGGWMPAAGVAGLRRDLVEGFHGEVVLEERSILEQDLARVPVLLRNPAYFRPFEWFARLLPLPRYTSFDPTPFLALFFPLFFGMMLGDLGYGGLLLLVAWGLWCRGRQRPLLRDAALILAVCSGYSLVFGVLFGEFFGPLGQEWFGLEPVWFERSGAILAMFGFAVSVGVVHVAIGLVFGLVTAWRRGERREAALRLVQVLVVLGLVGLVVALLLPEWVPAVAVSLKPVGVATVVVAVLLLVLGGLLAPLEMLKTLGNIVSYARIMAIGLTSVLLAQVAHKLGGMTGDITAGILVAGLLHAFNLVLGVFAPTVHALRLHYVEFFGKFLEGGGSRYQPLQKKPK